MPTMSFTDLTKHYGPVKALDGFTVDIASGRITAFLGANGSGKTTSMRLLLGLSEPTSGSATIDGRAYRDLAEPTRVVGAVLDQGFHPNRNARNHLRIAAAQANVSASRIPVVLELVGLTEAADRRVGGYSLGMRQRLALASALIGDPTILVLDEPFNGLDPEGITTLRNFLRHFADSGGTVFLSSHLLAEVAHSADDAVIIDHGRLVASSPVATLVAGTSTAVITTPDVDVLTAALQARGGTVTRTGPDQVTVTGLDRDVIGRTAAGAGVVILDMRGDGDDLETIFAALINDKERPS